MHYINNYYWARCLKSFIFGCLLIIISSPVLCDDALVRVYGGGLKLHDGTTTSIEMKSETVRIELHKTTYTVDATFEFFNYGKTATVRVGFPKSGHGYAPSFTGVINFASFETWVNDTKVEVEEMPGEVMIDDKPADKNQLNDFKKGRTEGWIEETRWLVKTVTFKEKTKTTTRVKYTAPYDSRRDEKFGEYLYGTGRSWKGLIGKASFIVKASPDVSLLWARFCENGYSKNIRIYEFKRLGEYEYEYVLKDIEPKENENFKLLANSTWQPWGGPDYSVKRVERERLELLSLWQLKILRNSIYATHGMMFNDPELDKYFRKYDWYKPNQDFKEADLNSIEKENVTAILKYENELRAALWSK